MSFLGDASEDERERLLGLFPVANLRASFGAGSKEDICVREAATATRAQISAVERFVAHHVGCCRQHVYVFDTAGRARLPGGIIDGARIASSSGSWGCYLVRATFTVTILEPLSQDTMTLLWPIKIDIHDGFFVVRFVILEKDVAALFGDNARITGKSLTEEDILARIAGGFGPCDFNTGVKELWRTDFHDCIQIKFKKAHSMSSEAMDERKGIKQHYPAVYSQIRNDPIYASSFKILDPTIALEGYFANPSNGMLGFPKYSPLGATDAVIRKILENN